MVHFFIQLLLLLTNKDYYLYLRHSFLITLLEKVMSFQHNTSYNQKILAQLPIKLFMISRKLVRLLLALKLIPQIESKNLKN